MKYDIQRHNSTWPQPSPTDCGAAIPMSNFIYIYIHIYIITKSEIGMNVKIVKTEDTKSNEPDKEFKQCNLNTNI